MRLRLSFLAGGGCWLLLTLSGCGLSSGSSTAPIAISPTTARATPTVEHILVTGDGREGVIFPDGDWIPSTEDVRTLEGELRSYLGQNQSAFHEPASIEERPGRYTRQYWGLLENEKKVVFINFFCDAFGMDWQHERVQVEDGGDCYFQLKYDVESGEFFDLRVNGEA